MTCVRYAERKARENTVVYFFRTLLSARDSRAQPLKFCHVQVGAETIMCARDRKSAGLIWRFELPVLRHVLSCYTRTHTCLLTTVCFAEIRVCSTDMKQTCENKVLRCHVLQYAHAFFCEGAHTQAFTDRLPHPGVFATHTPVSLLRHTTTCALTHTFVSIGTCARCTRTVPRNERMYAQKAHIRAANVHE